MKKLMILVMTAVCALGAWAETKTCTTLSQLRSAVSAGYDVNIPFGTTITVDSTRAWGGALGSSHSARTGWTAGINVDEKVKISGGGTIKVGTNMTALFVIGSGGQLTISDVTLDGSSGSYTAAAFFLEVTTDSSKGDSTVGLFTDSGLEVKNFCTSYATDGSAIASVIGAENGSFWIYDIWVHDCKSRGMNDTYPPCLIAPKWGTCELFGGKIECTDASTYILEPCYSATVKLYGGRLKHTTADHTFKSSGYENQVYVYGGAYAYSPTAAFSGKYTQGWSDMDLFTLDDGSYGVVYIYDWPCYITARPQQSAYGTVTGSGSNYITGDH